MRGVLFVAISINLAPQLVSFIHAKLESGRYYSADDVIAEALRLMGQLSA